MHTPGPWRVAGKASGHITYAGTDRDIGSVQIATVGAYRDKELLPFNRDRWDADARLIAAAPDLYEALSPVLRGADEADYYCPDDVAGDHTVLVSFTIAELRAARAALAKVSQQQGSPQDTAS